MCDILETLFIIYAGGSLSKMKEFHNAIHFRTMSQFKNRLYAFLLLESRYRLYGDRIPRIALISESKFKFSKQSGKMILYLVGQDIRRQKNRLTI